MKLLSANLGSLALSVRNISVRPARGAGILLRNLTFDIRKGSLAIFMGPVGSGKSTILKAIMAELKCETGSITASYRHISYCSQTPWLSNTDIRHNIRGPFEENERNDTEWYNTVLEACALDEDVAQFEKGDRTTVGSKGMNLSGGQKQRVALARALYAGNSIMVLDDVFSALDHATATKVFDRILGDQGLARRLGMTVILATHTVDRMSETDHILLLQADGSVAHNGPYDASLDLDLIVRQTSKESAPNVDMFEDTAQMAQKLLDPLAVTESPESQTAPKPPDGASSATYLYYLRAAGWSNVTIFLGLAVFTVLANSFAQVWLEWWVENRVSGRALTLSVYVALGLIQLICQGSYYWAILVRIAPLAGLKLHHDLLRTVLKAPMSFFNTVDTGVTLNRFSQDMTLIETPLSLGFLFTVLNQALAIAQLGLVASGSFYISAVVPFVLIVIYFLQKVYLRTSRQVQVLDLELKSPLYSHFLETLDGLATIRAFGWQDQSKRINIKHLNFSQRPYYLLWCIQRWLNLVLDLIVTATAILTVALALNFRTSTNQGLLGIALNNMLSFNLTLQSFITGWTMLETSLGAVTRLRNFTATTSCEENFEQSSQPPFGWPKSGSIEFRDVYAGYDERKPILRGVSLAVTSGQSVDVCGRTGSGKSTILSLISRLLEPSSGTISIDGLSIHAFTPDAIRTRILALSQEPVTLGGTLRNNIDPRGRSSDAAIVDALQKCLLWPDPLLTRSEYKDSSGDPSESAGIAQQDQDRIRSVLDVSMSKVQLSAGQIQLLALARGILRKHEVKLVLMDEVTSAMDLQTDRLVQTVLREEFKGLTVICVAHRMETLSGMDVIVEMENGTVKEMR